MTCRSATRPHSRSSLSRTRVGAIDLRAKSMVAKLRRLDCARRIPRSFHAITVWKKHSLLRKRVIRRRLICSFARCNGHSIRTRATRTTVSLRPRNSRDIARFVVRDRALRVSDRALRKTSRNLEELRITSRVVPNVQASQRDHALTRSVCRTRHQPWRPQCRDVAQWPRVAEGAALSHEPHRIAYFLYDVASAFHALWNQGTEGPELRFLGGGDPEITKARLALIQGVAAVLASGLAVLGVEPVEEMRG